MITGPAASGKSTAAMRRFLDDPASRLIVPSSTMAEHLRNELARGNLPVSPRRILTLDQFMEDATPLRRPPASLVRLLAEAAVPNQFPGYHRGLAQLVEEAPPDLLSSDLARLAWEIDSELEARGFGLRAKRLLAAEPRVTGALIFDGFFSFAPSELDLLERLAERTDILVTLPDWPGSTAARQRLLETGFREQRFETPLREPRRTVVAAPSLDREVEEIAVRILAEAAQGRPFREMGVLLRTREPYASALELVFARFGIPARFYFATPVDAHPAMQYLTGLVRCWLKGWDRAELAALIRMPVSGIGATAEGDVLDFELRRSLPSQGAPDWWREIPIASPERPAHWAAELRALRRYVPLPRVDDGASQEQVQAWRSLAAALDAFDAALDTTVVALGEDALSFARFWSAVETALSAEQLRVPDQRRNVVNVLDVYEARQWELPVTFVCGLNERNFPQYHREDPLMPDAARRKVGLPTSEDRQLEERFLFDLAVTRATGEVILSYTRFNDKGAAALRSFFLETEGEPVPAARSLPRAKAFEKPSIPPAPPVRLRHLSASAIESFLQCPFQYFAKKTLRLKGRPEKPRDRLNVLLQGTILHDAIATGSFEEAFARACAKENVPMTYRTEAVRLEILRNYEAFLADENWPIDWPFVSEEQFRFTLSPELELHGRIDRLYRGPGGEGVVVDFKYSSAATLKNKLDGDPVQGGIYLLAAEHAYGLAPAGMFYCALRQRVDWQGWHASLPGIDFGEKRSPEGLKELSDIAREKAEETLRRVAEGDRAARPADTKKCEYCDFRDICRVESQAVRTAGA